MDSQSQFHPVTVVPYHADPIDSLADRLLADHADDLPLLTNAVVLLADQQAAPRLRQLLLEKSEKLNHKALLGPQVMQLRDWVEQTSQSTTPIISDLSRELMLVDALGDHQSLFGDTNPWSLAESLLELFDALTLNSIGLPPNLEEFTRRIAEGYGAVDDGPAALEREASLVHTLWHAWHEQLHATGKCDRNSAYLLGLAELAEESSSKQFYLAGFTSFTVAETEWLQAMFKQQRLCLFLQGEVANVATDDYHPDTPISNILQRLASTRPIADHSIPLFSRFLNTLYCTNLETELPLDRRAQAFADTSPRSPLSGHLSVMHAASAEDEAVAVETQVRQWLIDGHKKIGILTENRRLARRIRALLERAGIILQDSAGWALSTTSAAALLERWLQCVEEDFPYLAMLDLLKSPFFSHTEERDQHLEDVYRLEQSLILQENIGSGMQRYRFALQSRRRRLPDSMASSMDRIDSLLQRLSDAAATLSSLTRTSPQPPVHFIETLQQSLTALGIDESLQNDDAGNQLLELIGEMCVATSPDNRAMSWAEFRSWLGRTFEVTNFRPSSGGGQVELMGLGQSLLGRYDALIIAAVEREFLPGGSGNSPFFNDAVRQQLGLPSSSEIMTERFHHFRRLLEAAPEVLLTLRREQDGEEILPSPWLENLLSFHQIAYGDDLENRELAELIHQPWSQIVNRDRLLPHPEGYPAPSVVASLLPSTLSASGYQMLMDCPYQFYAARCLGLSAPEAIREALEKSDYGEKVHRTLEAFHADVTGLPGPFKGLLTPARRDKAISLLKQIAESEFSRDLEDNFLQRDWLHRWQKLIPDYIDWQIAHSEAWQVNEVEQKNEQKNLIGGITLRGRIDRIDKGSKGLAIIDYKTGATPIEEDVLTGESIQLPFYRLLANDLPIDHVEYLSLDGNVKTKMVLEGEELESLSQDIAERLANIEQQLHNGDGIPAWGDEKSCGYCPMEGVCRRQSWLEENDE